MQLHIRGGYEESDWMHPINKRESKCMAQEASIWPVSVGTLPGALPARCILTVLYIYIYIPPTLTPTPFDALPIQISPTSPGSIDNYDVIDR